VVFILNTYYFFNFKLSEYLVIREPLVAFIKKQAGGFFQGQGINILYFRTVGKAFSVLLRWHQIYLDFRVSFYKKMFDCALGKNNLLAAIKEISILFFFISHLGFLFFIHLFFKDFALFIKLHKYGAEFFFNFIKCLFIKAKHYSVYLFENLLGLCEKIF